MEKGLIGGILAVVVIAILIVVALVVRPKTAEAPTPAATLQVSLATPEATPAAPTEPSVSVSNQAGGTTVTVDRAALLQNGFIAIHADAGGKPGPVLGSSALLPRGTHTAIAVTLTRKTRNGETLYAMLHTDVNGNGVYEFPGVDAPTTDSTGTLVSPSFTIGASTASSPSASPKSSPGKY